MIARWCVRGADLVFLWGLYALFATVTLPADGFVLVARPVATFALLSVSLTLLFAGLFLFRRS